MSDKQVRYSHVDIIESTPARAVIHWRYALSEVENQKLADAPDPSGWGAWADEILGLCTRTQWRFVARYCGPFIPTARRVSFRSRSSSFPQDRRLKININLDALTLFKPPGGG